MNDQVSLLTAVAALVAAVVAPMVAIRAARLQATRQVFVVATAQFWVSINTWVAAVRRVASSQESEQRDLALSETQKLRREIEQAYTTISLLSRSKWLEMHWLKRQLRVDRQLTELEAGDGAVTGLLVHLNDYELALPTLRERLGNEARREPH